MAIPFTCPRCSNPYVFPDELAGQLEACPFCKETVRIPVAEILLAEVLPEPIPEVRRKRPEGPGFRCPECGSTRLPTIERKVSLVGWVLFFVLLFSTIIFCFLGLFLKTEYRRCSSCRCKLD